MRECDEWLLEMLIQDADAGVRCATNPELTDCARENDISFGPGSLAGSFNRLQETGLLVTEITGRNFRRVHVRRTITDAWIATAPHPMGWKPHLVLPRGAKTLEDARADR